MAPDAKSSLQAKTGAAATAFALPCCLLFIVREKARVGLWRRQGVERGHKARIKEAGSRIGMNVENELGALEFGWILLSPIWMVLL